jgi:hypothetical protein
LTKNKPIKAYALFLIITIFILSYFLKIIEGNVAGSPFSNLENDIWNVIITMTTGNALI